MISITEGTVSIIWRATRSNILTANNYLREHHEVLVVGYQFIASVKSER
jgi:hypothetical protein